MMSKIMKIRFYSWLMVMIVFAITAVYFLKQGISLNTNVMDLMPQSSSQTDFTQASDIFMDRMGNQVLFLLSNPNKAKAQEAADSFVKDLNASESFKDIFYKVDSNQEKAWGSFYFPARMGLLTATQQKILENKDYDTIKNMALTNLYSPMGVSNSHLLQEDPFFLFLNYMLQVPKPSSHLNVEDGYLMTQAMGSWHVFIKGEISGKSFSLTNQEKLIQVVDRAEKNVTTRYDHTRVIKTGVLFYAADNAKTAQADIAKIGIGSLIGIIILLLITFRSLSPLLFTLISLVSGFIVAFVMTHFIFGSVYLFTLVFGASLMGVVVDYAFFYYAERLFTQENWNAENGLKNILPGITLGLLNVLIAFAIIACTPFPGLRQLAVFSMIGLTVAYSTVVCCFPMLLRKPFPKTQTFTVKVATKYLKFCQSRSRQTCGLLVCFLLVYGVIGLFLLRSSDDIHALQTLPRMLLNQEIKLKEIIGAHTSMNFILVTGETPEKVLENSQKLLKRLKTISAKNATSLISVNAYLPSTVEQEKNTTLTKSLIKTELLPYLNTLGMPLEKSRHIQTKLLTMPFKPLDVNHWLSSPVSDSLRYLWLGKVNTEYATVILFPEGFDTGKMQTIVQSFPFAHYENKSQEITEVFQHYRILLMTLLGIIITVMLGLFMFRYKMKKALYYFSPPFLACLLSLATLGYAQIPLTLFNSLGLLLVLGLSLDYVIFFAESRSGFPNTMLAVTLSAVTTVLSFGLLALSQTPVIHDFGFTILVGIISAFLLAPFVTNTFLQEIK